MSEHRIEAPPVIPKQSPQRFGKRSTLAIDHVNVRHASARPEDTKSRIRIGGMVLAVFGLGLVGHDQLVSFASNAAGCHIKGNISINTGEPIYHVPGQEHYRETKISPQYGERWFCT